MKITLHTNIVRYDEWEHQGFAIGLLESHNLPSLACCGQIQIPLTKEEGERFKNVTSANPIRLTITVEDSADSPSHCKS